MDKIYIAILISLLIGGLIGYQIGYVAGLNWSVEKAIYFLELKGIKIDINSKMITAGLRYYQDNVNVCYPTIKNASIFNDKRG